MAVLYICREIDVSILAAVFHGLYSGWRSRCSTDNRCNSADNFIFICCNFARLARFWLGDGGNHFPFNENTEKVMIYGAGLSGRQLASAISSISQMSVVGFLDDDETLQGRVLNGIPIFKPDGLEHLIKKCK